MSWVNWIGWLRLGRQWGRLPALGVFCQLVCDLFKLIQYVGQLLSTRCGRLTIMPLRLRVRSAIAFRPAVVVRVALVIVVSITAVLSVVVRLSVAVAIVRAAIV